MGPADFYTGIVADLYAPLKAHSQDPDRYDTFVRQAGTPALELGCGDGDPLLELRRRGLDVDGVDSSADMLARLRHRADAQGTSVTTYHQRMEALDLPRRYRSVFLAGPTFNLLPDDATALAALRGIERHLTEDGTALIPLFTPAPSEEIGEVRTVTAPDGAELRVSAVSERRDERARTQTTVLRYERHHGEDSVVEDRPWVLHWYPRDHFERLAAQAGLKVTAVTGDDTGVLDLCLRPA
ncbi:class I SAM-dependent methyltransferase [Streptomyces acidiscabies]|uniref:class I SAM-dependent methyltransferase n=1 Tax=Streptomyces acidiscabies TaxID=42234 RepID=UPI0038F6EC0A